MGTVLRRSFALITAFALTAFSSGCSDRRLVPVEDNQIRTYDDLVDIEASFCTRTAPPVAFPVKVLLVLDGSGSLQFTDQSATRREAVQELMNSLRRQKNVQVATMVFGSNIYIDPQIVPGTDRYFIPAEEWTEPAFLTVADVQTNYHGALAAVRTHLLMDMLASDPAELARTKYVVIFFSDGAPTPKCCLSAEETVGDLGELPFGCAPEPYEVATAGTRYCEGEEEQAVCNDEDWLDNFRNYQENNNAQAGAAPDYGDGTLAALNELEANDNYNRTYQVEDLIREIVDLGDNFGVGELRFHTALLFDSQLPDAVKQIYRLNRCRSEGLLKRMAELGNGVFRDFENGDAIDFLSFNFTALQQSYSLLANYAVNMSALPAEGGFIADTDGDGISDSDEFSLGTDVAVADSDKLTDRPNITQDPSELQVQDRNLWGDGYSDLIEMTFEETGFDPRYQSLPLSPCPEDMRYDIDADMLNDCEEELFETDPEIPDTDGDGLPDGLEVRLGLDPLLHEQNRDDDFDGIENMREVRRGSDPLVADAASREGLAYRYELIERDPLPDGRQCYTSVINDVRLVTTEPRVENGRRGYNDIYVWIAETPTDNPTGRTDLRFACFRAQYIAPSYKDPPQGKIELFEDQGHFWDLSDDDSRINLLTRIANGQNICQGKRIE